MREVKRDAIDWKLEIGNRKSGRIGGLTRRIIAVKVKVKVSCLLAGSFRDPFWFRVDIRYLLEFLRSGFLFSYPRFPHRDTWVRSGDISSCPVVIYARYGDHTWCAK